MTKNKQKLLYFYQTFVGLNNILQLSPQIVTDIHIASIHFGINNNNYYIHLNDYLPNNSIFDTLWKDIKVAYNQNIKISLLIGGAGGGFNTLFSNFTICYKLLYDVLQQHSYITGINLDIEEFVELSNVKMLIQQIKKDFPHYEISLSPISGALTNDMPGLGGFSYKDLLQSKEGQYINYLCGQFYGSFNIETYNQIIQNNYKPEQIIIGMDSNMIDFTNALQEITKIKQKYPNFCGVFVWEYCNAPPDKTDHSKWITNIYNSLYNNSSASFLSFNIINFFNSLF